MRIAWHSNSFYFLGLISVVSFAISHFLSEPKPLARSDYLAPPKVIEKLSSGLKVASSDSFWLRAIQDFDFCSAHINDRECHGKSWLFHVLDLVTDLDPRFYYAFYAGGLDLTVVISDYEGASKIFDKGVPLYPKKWRFLYAAGYHAYFEEKNKVKAGKLFFQAAENGAPEWLKKKLSDLKSTNE